ncbi:alpha/beta fold hydrolase [Ferrovum sp. PN-J185]|uniref:YheT family hydrolase n=1 Tax=Ferrovum sp. PN-J185 TaxID=1356306 RepID=UPI0007983A45|nr:alpha/beta fold hydrolase [Ferrovum sp. PN-J185]KXW55716.1 putative hydrolase [Ferrovum sp. PN-J185]MCC6068586.1 alpha/beta fold hydrolase [Ferrovum sp. PN-J185]MDE1892101.1 alpha/beta fold hydrolase [Betaproteobacteria bacterium]
MMSNFSYKHFTTSWWLKQPHIHTIYGARYVPCPPIPWLRKTVSTPDDDFLDIDYIEHPQAHAIIVLIHGLEGNSQSRYIRSLAHTGIEQGFHVVAPNLRGCSGPINLMPRLYHAGDSQEFDWLIPLISGQFSNLPIFVVGFSLGANILLKWLAEKTSDKLIKGAVAIAPPLDLETVASTLNQGFNRVYTHHFLSTLKPKAKLKAKQFPGLFDLKKVLTAKNMFEFDEYFMAPLHGFKGARDYWSQSSAGPHLHAISTPTLLVMSQDDPFIPKHLIPKPSQLSHSTQLITSQYGGHVGFVNGRFPGFLQWIPDIIMSYCKSFND